MSPLDYPEYLTRIQGILQVRGVRPDKKDLPRRVFDIVLLVEEIEKLIKPRRRSDLPKEIEDILTSRNDLINLTTDIGRELIRATGRPLKTRLLIEDLQRDILPELKAILSSLEAVQREVQREARSEDHERIPLTKLDQHLRQILIDYYHKTESSREILRSISCRLYPTNSEPSNFEDLPSKVALLVEESKDRNEIEEIVKWYSDRVEELEGSLEKYRQREAATRNAAKVASPVVEGKDRSEIEAKLKWYTDRVDELEKSLERYRERKEAAENAPKEMNALITGAFEDAEQLRKTVDAKQFEIDKLKATETELTRSRNSLKTELDEATRLLEAEQGEIQRLRATEKNLRDTNAGAMKRAQVEKNTAIAEVEKGHSEQINKLKAKHEDELADQKSSIELHYKSEMFAQRKKHDDDKRGIEKQHHFEKEEAKGLLKEQQKRADSLQAKLAEEVREHERSRSDARKQAKEHDMQRITRDRQHAQILAEQIKQHSSDLKSVEADKIEQIEKLRTEHKRQISESEKAWKQVVRGHEAEKIKLQKALQEEEASSIRKVEAEGQKHQLVIDGLKTDLRAEKVRTTEKVEEEAKKHKSTIEKLEAELGEERARTAEKVEAEAKKHRNTIEKLKNTIEQLETHRKKLLAMHFKQEEYPGLSDQEILRGVAAKTGKVSIVGFSSMVSKVTTFSEWEWREDRKIWSKETLTALVGTKQRLLKKLILGDAIWTTLYQLIFCSPFRILGKEGEHLEADWNGSFPSGDAETKNEYSWPMPTFFSEKYRWESCEAALNSLTKPYSPYSPLRHSFVKHQGQFEQCFLETVQAFVNLTGKRKQDLLAFLTDTVRMWIVLCTQRYRIRLLLPGSNESDPEKKSRLAQEDNDFEFTVEPRLQRHGNANGEQYEGVSVVSGCDGKVAAVKES